MSVKGVPTSRPGSNSRNGDGGNSKQPRADFVLKSKFLNTMPDIPFDGKFLPCPFVPISRFIEYSATSLEQEFKYDVQAELDMGINIDLVDPDTYRVSAITAPLDEKDRFILEEETGSSLGSRRSAQHSRVVPWMRKTEYISSEFNRFGTTSDRSETKVGLNLRRAHEDGGPVIHRDRQSQIDAIQKTFEDAKIPAKNHYNKKGVHAVEEFFILPELDMWKQNFAQVHFDADPANHDLPEGLRKLALTDCMIHGMDAPDGQQYIGCFSPSVETLQKKLDDKSNGSRLCDPEHTYTYPLHREYNFTLKTKASKGYEQECFFFYLKNGKMHFQELETRLNLERRRRPPGQSKPKTFLQIKYHDPTEEEIEQMNERLKTLLHPQQEEEEETMDAEENEDGGEEGSGDEEKAGSDSDNASDKESGSQRKAQEKSSSSSDDEDDKSERSKSSSPASDSD